MNKRKAKSLPEHIKERSAETILADTFRKADKERLLPDVFYLRWEVELLCAFVAIIVLMLLPDWLNHQAGIFLSRYRASMNTAWITLACNILLACLLFYVVARLLWLWFVGQKETPSAKKLQFARTTDHVAEYIFSACIIILILIILVSFVQFLGILLKAVLSGRMNTASGTNQ